MFNKKNSFMLRVASLVSIGGILYGYDMGVISGALLFIEKSISLTDFQIGLIVGAVLGGGLIGTLLAGPIGDKYGRRSLIAFSSIIFILGVVCILFANTFLMLFLARIFLGVGVGLVSVSVPLYVAEIVPTESRGKYVTLFQLLLTFGIVLAYFVDLFFTPSGNWRAMFAVLFMPAFVLLLGVIYLPETPRWLIANKKLQQAKFILHQIYCNETKVSTEVANIYACINNTNHSKWRDLSSSALILPALIAIFIAIFNQLTGINLFLQYAPLILKKAGIDSNVVSMFGSVGIGILNFIFTFVAIFLIDRVGRRPLLLFGIAGVVFSEVLLGFINNFFESSQVAGMFSLVGLFIFIISFAVGPGVVVWLAISELFPTMLRGKGMSLCLFFSSLAATALSVLFLPLEKMLGMGQTYWLFAAFSFAYLVMVYFFLPETKAKSLEEVQAFFKKDRSISNSSLSRCSNS